MKFRLILRLVVSSLGIVALSASGGGGTQQAGAKGGAPGSTGPSSLELFAGDMGGAGSADGNGAAARFNQPQVIAVDGEGNVYVGETYTIRKITPDGTVSTFAGKVWVPGSADGSGAEARFNGVAGVAVDRAGNVYAADSSNCTIRKITPAGGVSTLAGKAGEGGSGDGSGAAARFKGPQGIATD